MNLAWDDFRLVKAVAEGRTLAAAAERLGVNTSTVFRRLGTLEKRLGARLFERLRAGYALTPAGEDMVGLAARMSDEVNAFERRVAGQDLRPTGDLRLTTNDAMILYVLTPILARFREAFPNIVLEVVVSNDAFNLSRRDADVAIRVSDNPPENLVGRRLADIAWAIYGPASEPDVESIDALAGRGWVCPGPALGHVRATRIIRDRIPGERVVYTLNTVGGLAEAIAAGIGVGPLPCYIGESVPGMKRLARIDKGPEPGLWILTHADLRGSARVRAFLDFVGGELSRKRQLFECRNGGG